MKETTFYQNPDFDEIFIFYDLEVPTSKKQFKPIDEQLQKNIQGSFPEITKTLYYKDNKENAQSFIKEMQIRLLNKKKLVWPYKEELLLVAGVSGTKKQYGAKDLDNILKSVLDAFKGIVFEDDKQVRIVIASKQIWEYNMKGLSVGLRKLDPNKIDKYEPALYGEELKDWEDAFHKKFKEINPNELYNSFGIY